MYVNSILLDITLDFKLKSKSEFWIEAKYLVNDALFGAIDGSSADRYLTGHFREKFI